jgi:phosphomannomutase
MRPDSFELASHVRAGLVTQGRNVIDIGCVASDMIYYAVGAMETAGGAMVTASHNPGKYNGIKLCGEGARGISLDAGLAEIRDAIKADDFKEASRKGEVTEKNVMVGWVEHALGFVDSERLKPYHIAVDAGNGMAGAVVPGNPCLPSTDGVLEVDGPEAPPLSLEASLFLSWLRRCLFHSLSEGISSESSSSS